MNLRHLLKIGRPHGEDDPFPVKRSQPSSQTAWTVPLESIFNWALPEPRGLRERFTGSPRLRSLDGGPQIKDISTIGAIGTASGAIKEDMDGAVPEIDVTQIGPSGLTQWDWIRPGIVREHCWGALRFSNSGANR